jgi:hypothetical protein
MFQDIEDEDIQNNNFSVWIRRLCNVFSYFEGRTQTFEDKVQKKVSELKKQEVTSYCNSYGGN